MTDSSDACSGSRVSLAYAVSLLKRGWISDESWYSPNNCGSRHKYCPQVYEMNEMNLQSAEAYDFDDSLETEELDSEQECGDDMPGPEASGSLERFVTESMEILISRVMHQDELALAALYSRLSGPVFSLALQITRNVECAEEVLQDVFWQVWRQAPRFDRTRGSVPAWVLIITRSRALDTIRSQMRTPQTQISGQNEIDDGLSSTEAGPQDLLFAAQQGSRLKEALEGLDPLRRQLVSLSFYRGLTQQEIAEKMGLPLGTVKSHLRRSMATLREALGVDVAPALN